MDEGVGIPPDRRAIHNAALREPQAGVGDVRFMGLHVVARLAARHGIVVELRDSSGPGTIAEITLPPGVLVTMERNTAASPWETGTPPGAGARRRPSPAGPPVGAPPVRVDRGGRARTRPGASPAPGGRAGRPDRRGQRVGSARPQAQRSAAVALGQQAREHRAAPRDDRPPQAAPPP
ncbi:hypothetical protein ACW23B_00960 [Streptomyces albidoflavus]